MSIYRIIILFAIFLFFGCNQQEETAAVKPNILLIIADDLGYTDLGCYGGEINTPTIDSLAATGMLFTNFHTGAMCAPSRAMLFTGQEHHLAGWGRQRDVRGTFYEGKWGYENELSSRVLAFPRILQKNNYKTFFAGKWHLGKSQESDPSSQGFDQSFVLMQGASNHWNGIGLGLSKFDGEKSIFRRNGKKATWPEGKFSTTVYTDEVLAFIETDDDDRPFFAVASYTAPHWPLQPPFSHKEKYKGQYSQGYESLRAQRLKSSQKKGITNPKINLPEGLLHIKPWSELSEHEQKEEERKMELYAAMLDHLDSDIGRLLAGLREKNKLENTIVVFMSDNGADFLDFYNHPIGGFLRDTYDNQIDNMGNPTSFVAYGPQWAQAGMSPYSYYKGYLAEGGVRAPLVISGPNVVHQKIDNQFLHITDLAPTILNLCNLEYDENFEGKDYPPLLGKTFAQALQGEKVKVHSEEAFFVDDFQGMASVLQGDFKLFNQENPSDESKFGLYNIKDDPGEKNDLSEALPQKVNEMMVAWRNYKEKYKVVYPDDTESLNPYKENQ